MRYDLPGWDTAVEVLRGASAVAIACHVNPDGDALGSVLGTSLALRKRGAITYPSWGSAPFEVPFALSFLPAADTFVPPEQVPVAPVFLALDCGARDRLGSLERIAMQSEVVINVDHHPGNDNFGSLNLVAPSASSTAEMVTLLLRDVGVDMDRDIATCLYTGIVTDTGSFQYENATPETLRLAAYLLEFGVPAPEVARELFQSSPFGFLKLTGRVLDRAELFEEEGFVYSWITQDDLAMTGVALDETERLVDLIRSTRAADVSAMFKQQSDGTFRVSLRSKGRVSVGAIARARGGGGHELAAGFTASDVTTTVQELVQAVRTAPAPTDVR